MACEDMNTPPPFGSMNLRCPECLRLVWLAPTSPYWTEPMRILCSRCASKHPPEAGDSKIGLTEEQRLEIATATGWSGDAIDAALEQIKARLWGKDRE